jgi:MFS family permease
MQNPALSPQRPAWQTPLVVILAACFISLLGFGVRSSLGLFLEPITSFRGWNRETYALAMAIQNLLWGAAVPFASALADRYGPSRVLALGALIYGGGIWGMSVASSGMSLHFFGGLLTGLGVAFTAFSIALASIAKVVSLKQRSLALGLGTSAGSMGQVLASPLCLGFIAAYGWQSALFIMAASLLAIIPLAFLLPRSDAAEPGQAAQSISEAVREATRHRGFVLLTLGFFVCGFHVAFITVHFPAYVKDLGLDPSIGAWAISLVGLLNIVGSFVSGAAGQRWSKKNLLSIIYTARAFVIGGLLLAPKTETTIYAFAVFMGLLWLATVPLTSGIVAQVFGVRYMATLFGIVFFSHQVGSFSGVWLGGYLYDVMGSYDPVWLAGIGLSFLAALIHLPIDEDPLPRLKQT